MRLLLARGVWLLHIAIVGFFLVGWTLPWREALWIVAIGAPVLQLGWWLCGDVCWLTLVEERLRGRDSEPEDAPPNFVAVLAERLAGRSLPVEWVNRVIYAVVWGGFAVAAARLALGR